MKENFKIIGEWFLPNQQNRVHGTLNFEKNGKSTLELYGSLTSDEIFPEFKDQEIILGISSKSKEITLSGCFMTKSGGATLVQGKESGKSSITYLISYIFIGLHVSKTDELIFDNISAEIFNLDEWVGISGFKRDKLDYEKFKNHEYSINYKLPESIEFEIDKTYSGKFSFSVNISGLSIYQKSQQISQQVQFQIDSKKETNFSELLKKVNRFQNFLLLALYKNTFILSVKLKGESHKEILPDGIEFKKNIELFFSTFDSGNYDKPKSFREMIFSYREIASKFPELIKNWYGKYDLLEPAFNLLFDQFYQGTRFNENSFLNLAQSAETFHARIHNHTKIPREEYNIMKEEILKTTDSKYHKWLKEQFNFGNNLNLHLRLEEITEKYSNEIIDKIIPDKDKFVFQVKHSRNYYTHYSSSSKKNALKGSDLFYLSEKLKLLLVCSFLMESGFSKEELSKSLDNVKWNLFNQLANWRENKK
ncbi:ApeA N-terminal domain 1-containing protein [Joostella sp. CR20]|uniref:ApeA N-terminal domain 1-containing protein n=1 Tax=Joostella sp. CR20 TaxID=2804312 RepID=UPI00313B185D